MKRDEFINHYVDGMKKHLQHVLPQEAPERRMIEITRRQHHHDVNFLQQLIIKEGEHDKEKGT